MDNSKEIEIIGLLSGYPELSSDDIDSISHGVMKVLESQTAELREKILSAESSESFHKSKVAELQDKLKEAGWDDEMHKSGRNKWHKEYLKLRKEVDRLEGESAARLEIIETLGKQMSS